MLRNLQSLVLLTVLGTPLAASATTAADLCGPAADPCNVTRNVIVGSGSTIDVGARALVVKRGSSLDVGGGTMTIRAGSLTLEPGAALLARGLSGAMGGSVTVVTTGAVTLQVDGNARGRIDVSGDGSGGSIAITAGGDVVIDGGCQGKGTTLDADGGSLDVTTTGSATVRGDLEFTGGSQSEGGDVSFTTNGPILVTARIDVGGGDIGGGSVDLDSLSTVTTAAMVADGGGAGGDGGFVFISGDGDVTIGGPITVAGAGQADFGGDGGEVDVLSSTNVRIQAQIAGPSGDGGSGGSLDIEATAGDVTVTAPLKVNGIGSESCGGDVFVSAGGSLGLVDVDASGALCGGGSLDASAVNGRATIGGELDLDGEGGSVTLLGEQLLVTSVGFIHTTAGQGAFSLSGCTITVASGGKLQATGTRATTTIQASGQLQIAGTVTSGGTNRFEYRTVPPVLSGGVSPAAQVVQNAALPPCRVAPCGNGTTDPGEGCDDGNNASCDGCSAACAVERCGNGVVDCGEQCDGGTSCDASCRLITVGGLLFLSGEPTAIEGCYLEWAIRNPNGAVSGDFPSRTQSCIDGDPECDGDGVNDGQCTFQVKTCMHVADARLPECQLLGITNVSLRRPDALDPADAVEADNAAALITALSSNPVEVRAGSTIIRPGTPNFTADSCSPLVDLRVPHDPGRQGQRNFTLAAQDILERRMRSNQLELVCLNNPAVCGNGAREVGEQCDDGNKNSCDGCSSACRTEACGNGVLECAEECDDGPANGTPGSVCTASCTVAPPALRVSGGGKGLGECDLEWSLALASPATDKQGQPSFKQECTDGDPTCDFSVLPNLCRFHLWMCLGGEDPRYACLAEEVTSVELLKPNERAKAPLSTLRNALLGALTAVGLPAGPGEVCTRRVDVDVPAGRRFLSLRTKALGASGSQDRDTLKLRCNSSLP